jgi:hypothetical protein
MNPTKPAQPSPVQRSVAPARRPRFVVQKLEERIAPKKTHPFSWRCQDSW